MANNSELSNDFIKQYDSNETFYQNLLHFLDGKELMAIAPNSVLMLVEGAIVYTLHSTHIMKVYANNTIVLNNGGYKTKITLQRINALLTPVARVKSIGGVWHVLAYGNSLMIGHVKDYVFVSGYMLNATTLEYTDYNTLVQLPVTPDKSTQN